jgi:hypothetical protein
MKILMAQSTRNTPKTSADEDEVSKGNDLEDEKPQIVLGKNVTSDDANLVIQKLADSSCSGRGMLASFMCVANECIYSGYNDGRCW